MNIDEARWTTHARVMAESGIARSVRLAARLSLSEMASVVRIAPSTLSRYERNQRVPRGDAAVRYGRALEELASR